MRELIIRVSQEIWKLLANLRQIDFDVPAQSALDCCRNIACVYY